MSELHSEKYLRDRKFWLFLPAVIVPFLTLFFWLMGGGAVTTEVVTKKNGLNTQLPTAKVKDSVKDKMAFYVSADADSSRRLEQMRMDPYRKDSMPVKIKVSEIYRPVVPMNRETEEISKRIEAIQKKMAAGGQAAQVYAESKTNVVAVDKPPTAASPDPEMEAINGTLDKILAIQHPERIKEKSIERKTTVYSISSEASNMDNSFFGRRDTSKRKTVFHEDAMSAGETKANSIAAEVDVTQILQTGSLLRMRLRSNIYVGGMTVPAGTVVFGICSFNQDRLSVHIPSIGYAGNILPVSLDVYDLTGLPGIYAPGSIAGEVVKQSTDQSLQSIGLLNLDPSVGSQLTAAGIGAAKNMLSRKVKQITVTVKAGYRVYLKDETVNR